MLVSRSPISLSRPCKGKGVYTSCNLYPDFLTRLTALNRLPSSSKTPTTNFFKAISTQLKIQNMINDVPHVLPQIIHQNVFSQQHPYVLYMNPLIFSGYV